MTQSKVTIPVPVDYNVVVELEPVSDRAGKTGVILKPDDLKEREQFSMVKGTLRAVGPNAFKDFGEPCPKPGDVVLFRKFSGQGQTPQVAMDDTIRVMPDKDILAIVP